MMGLPEILLVDQNAALVRAWGEAFGSVSDVTCVHGDFFAHSADAMVSPANSFGIMDGGLDRLIRNTLGFDVQTAAQEIILRLHHGEMPVGTAEVLHVAHPRWPYLIIAPTMRVPESVATSLNAYLAFRAILLTVQRHNTNGSAKPVKTLLCPGLGTGVGAMDARRCAAQMKIAFKHVSEPARMPSFSQIHSLHNALRSC